MSFTIGKNTYGHQHIKLRHWGEPTKLVVGNFCSIAFDVTIYLGGNHRMDWVTTFPFPNNPVLENNNIERSTTVGTKGDVVIGNDVWIGDNVTIMSGITIGDGACIACNSHIVKDVEPYSLVGGNPAKLIKYRFTEEQIKKLLEIKWWFWEDEKINKYVPLLLNENIDQFISAANENN